VGGLKAPVSGSRRVPSAASTWSGASAAHSPIAASDLAPANTAQTATASTAPSARRRPRRRRGSGNWARSASRLRHWSLASAAGATAWAAAGIGDDEQAGKAVRSGHGIRHPHDRWWPCLLDSNSALARSSQARQVCTLPEPCPPPAVLPAYGHIPPFTCGFSQPVVTAGARCAPLTAGRVCTQRVPLAPVHCLAGTERRRPESESSASRPYRRCRGMVATANAAVGRYRQLRRSRSRPGRFIRIHAAE
jgi:hypothetical protein